MNTVITFIPLPVERKLKRNVIILSNYTLPIKGDCAPLDPLLLYNNSLDPVKTQCSQKNFVFFIILLRNQEHHYYQSVGHIGFKRQNNEIYPVVRVRNTTVIRAII